MFWHGFGMETGRKTSKKPNDMQSFHYIIRTLLHLKGSNLLKVVSLGLGLAMSILLFSRVAFEQSYDTCFHDYDRLYQVWMQYTVKGEKLDWQQQNLGPLAGAILESFPEQVESATCINRWMASDPLYYGNTRFDEPKICADSLFFRTMGIEVLTGNPVQDLQQPNVVYLCETLARRMFGGEDPIGKVISYNYQRDLTVRGTYADLPDNTTVKADAVISLPPSWAAEVANYSWNGGDSYPQYVRLKQGADAEAVNQRMEALIDKHLQLPPEFKAQMGLAAKIAPLRDTYRGYEDVQRSKVILLVMGFAILFIAALNYALISISSLYLRDVPDRDGAHYYIVPLRDGIPALCLPGLCGGHGGHAIAQLADLAACLGAGLDGAFALRGGRRAAGTSLCKNPRDAGVPPLHGGKEGMETFVAFRAVCRRGLHLRGDDDGDGAIQLCNEQGHGPQREERGHHLSPL